MFSYLQKHGANVIEKHLENALMIAALKGQSKAAKILIQNGDLTDNLGQTALIMCSDDKHLKTAKILIRYGANLNIRDNNGYSAQNGATYKGHDKMVELFIKNGADLLGLLLANGANINERDSNVWTTLMIAAWKSHVSIVEYLLQMDADVEVKSNMGTTALCGTAPVTRLLLEHDANLDGCKNKYWIDCTANCKLFESG